MNLVKNHKALGTEMEYYDSRKDKDIVGVVTGVQKGNMLRNMSTGKVYSKTVKLRIKPNDGAAAHHPIILSDADMAMFATLKALLA